MFCNLPFASLCSFKYPGRDDFGMRNMNIGIDMGSRVAIVGPNGAGECLVGSILWGWRIPRRRCRPAPKEAGAYCCIMSCRLHGVRSRGGEEFGVPEA